MTTPAPISPFDDRSIERIVDALERRRASPKSAYPRNDLLLKAGELVLAAVIAWGVANSRISVLETRVNDMKADIGVIMQDVKSLLQRR